MKEAGGFEKASTGIPGAKQYNHKEAFCLMQYRCDGCGFTELLWNSRDGVTPFTIKCIRCGEFSRHVNWHADKCFPDYKPTKGQRVFSDLTMEKAMEEARKMIDNVSKKYSDHHRHMLPSVEALAKDYFGNGDQPTIIIIE